MLITWPARVMRQDMGLLGLWRAVMKVRNGAREAMDDGWCCERGQRHTY